MIAASSNTVLKSPRSTTGGDHASQTAACASATLCVAALCCAVLGAASSVFAALPVAVALGLGGAMVVFAAAVLVDVSEHRLPNGLLAAAACVVAVSHGLAVVSGDVDFVGAVTGIAVGVLVCGAPLLIGLWLVRPDTIGGGDIKMLTVVGAALGSVDPVAALMAGWVAVLVQLCSSAVLRCRQLAFGPALLAGFVVGIVSTRWFRSTIGPA